MGFYNTNLGTWEQFELVDSAAVDQPWNRTSVALRSRRLPQVTRADLVSTVKDGTSKQLALPSHGVVRAQRMLMTIPPQALAGGCHPHDGNTLSQTRRTVLCCMSSNLSVASNMGRTDPSAALSSSS